MRNFINLFVLLTSSIPCFSQPSNNDKLLKTRLDSVLKTVMDANGPGGSIFIQKGNRTLYSASYGFADLDKKEKFTPQTLSNLGSISKTFVAYGILILQQQGKLSIDDDVNKYFPDFRNKEIGARVKIRHLLTHTSGLPDSRGVDKDSIFYLTAKDEENFAPLKLTDTLEFEPGSQYKYSNPAFNGLALVIEKVSGMKWQKFIEENIFKPSGMMGSRIQDGPYPEKGIAHAYRKVNGKYQEYDYGEYPTFAASGNGGVWSSIDELKKYVTAIKNCAFLKCEQVKFSQQAWVPGNWKSKDPPSLGFSWFVRSANNQPAVVEHTGSQAGFRAHLIMIPESELLIIWLTNNDLFITSQLMKPLTELGYLNTPKPRNNANPEND